MLRRIVVLRIGVESDVFMSRIHDKKYLEHQLANLGKMEAAGKFSPPLMSQEEVLRFTTSTNSKENLANKEAGTTPTAFVGKDGRVEGSAHLDPTRYGDWESDGRCHDF